MLSTILTFLLSLVGTATMLFSNASDSLSAQAANALARTKIGNIAPTVETITIAGNTGAPSSSFERTITFNGIADDRNGALDITKVSFVAWRDTNPLGAACTTDPNHCYHIESCTINSATGNPSEVWYYCAISMPQAYSYGIWHAKITAKDLDNATGSKEIIMPVDAFSFETPTSIYYPPKQADKPTPEEQATTPIPQVPQTPETPSAPSTTPQEAAVVTGTDCIAEFYARIEKPQPENRRSSRHTEACGDSLRVASRDSGLLVFDVSDSQTPTKGTTRAITIELPPGASSEWLTLHAERILPENFQKCTPIASAVSCGLFEYDIINDTFFRVYARDHNEEILASLTAAARVTLVIPEDLTGLPVRVYRLSENSTIWEEVTVEDFDTYTVSFRTAQLGTFAILASEKYSAVDRAYSRILTLLAIGGALILVIGAILLLLMTLFRKQKPALMQGPMRSYVHPRNPITGNPNEPHTP